MTLQRLLRNTNEAFITLMLAALLAACNNANTRPVPSAAHCDVAQTRNLDAAFESARQSLQNGCEIHFDTYLGELLTVAEGDPSSENKQRFSEFLIWASDEGLLSKRQAKTAYNRYFNVKFVAMMGDYNNCSHTCVGKQTVLTDMEQELADKERGLLKISLDKDGYYRADRLFKETQLVLEATCAACAAAN